MIFVDTFEPGDIFKLIKQVLPASDRMSLNSKGMADYMFFDIMGRRVQFERKQWGEILSGLDHVEDQLRGEYETADELNLIVEGTIQPTAYGLDFYKLTNSKDFMRKSHSYGDRKHPRQYLLAQVYSWLWQLDKTGITVYFTPNAIGTATLLVSCFKNSQKEEHTTLQRYIKERVQLKELNPYVKTLMGIEAAGLGPERAQSLIDYFGDPYGVFTSDEDELKVKRELEASLMHLHFHL